ncbi:protein angel isoform X2 [Megalopta genalis]
MGTVTNCQFNHHTSMDSFLGAYYSANTSCESTLNFNVDTFDEPQNFGAEEACFDSQMSLKDKYLLDRQKYKTMRQWTRFKKEKLASNSEEFFILRLLSFNILAQCLLETYPFLYKGHDKRALSWKIRRQLLLQEILGAQANVICLQEVQEDHLEEFLVPFRELGYNYVYKRRTNDKRDGLLFLYRADQFVLLDYAKVELYQSGIELLSRDNVGIIAKLAVKDCPDTQFVIATTHLLYNPKRNDVRLGQTQLLLAEIERIAFLENTLTGAKYLPIILAGDFNLVPYSGVYEFLTEGVFEYEGKGKNLKHTMFRSLSNSLIPPRLCITDNCQHFNILKKRLRGEGSAKIMLENSEEMNLEENLMGNSSSVCSDVNADTSDHQVIEVVRGCQAKFSSGTLTHPFHFSSVYKHQNHQGQQEATTNQGSWITVDYIFYSNVEPLEKYRLPTVEECNMLPTIPNFAVGSDHLCLGATFKVRKLKL